MRRYKPIRNYSESIINAVYCIDGNAPIQLRVLLKKEPMVYYGILLKMNL